VLRCIILARGGRRVGGRVFVAVEAVKDLVSCVVEAAAAAAVVEVVGLVAHVSGPFSYVSRGSDGGGAAGLRHLETGRTQLHVGHGVIVEDGDGGAARATQGRVRVAG